MLSIKNIVENSKPTLRFICLFIYFARLQLKVVGTGRWYRVFGLDLSYENCASIGSEIQDQCWVYSKYWRPPHESQWIQKAGVLIRAPVNQFTTAATIIIITTTLTTTTATLWQTHKANRSRMRMNIKTQYFVNMIYSRNTGQKKNSLQNLSVWAMDAGKNGAGEGWENPVKLRKMWSIQ